VISLTFRILLFFILSIFFTFISRRSLRNRHSHGFYRYFAFEGVTILVLYNHPVWFNSPFSALQCLSWLLLLLSVALVIHGFVLLKRVGGQEQRAACPENLPFENTKNLVQSGLYCYIRHPMYSSLLLLAWGAFLKRIDLITLTMVVMVSVALFLTAKVEEGENVSYFGNDYRTYQARSKMFFPFVF